MEGIEARALKSSLQREISMMKTTQQVLLDDLWCLNGGNVGAGEEFSVDDLLDLSNEKFEGVYNEEEEEEEFEEEIEEEEEKDSSSDSSSQERLGTDDDFLSNSTAGDLQAFPAVPVEEWKDLEWVSQFVDDSTTDEFSLLYPVGNFNDKTGTGSERRPDRETKPASQKPPSFPTTIPGKPRTKRSRTAATAAWSLSSTDSSSTASLSSSSSIMETMEFLRNLGRPPVKKPKRKRSAAAAAAAGGAQAQRRCSHCQVQKTPQWRTGPLGAKTLCNACGVRFKSGRLFPEYRPACSPTFSVEVHSNSHRKVLEIRRKKEMTGEAESGLAQMIPSC